ncbi:MAG: hypothetical protein ACLTDF_04895 [Coprococcus sp.]
MFAITGRHHRCPATVADQTYTGAALKYSDSISGTDKAYGEQITQWDMLTIPMPEQQRLL